MINWFITVDDNWAFSYLFYYKCMIYFHLSPIFLYCSPQTCLDTRIDRFPSCFIFSYLCCRSTLKCKSLHRGASDRVVYIFLNVGPNKCYLVKDTTVKIRIYLLFDKRFLMSGITQRSKVFINTIFTINCNRIFESSIKIVSNKKETS